MSISKKLLQIFIFAFAALVFSFLFVIGANAASEGGGTVNVDSLNFRSAPSTSAECIGSADKGDTVIILSSDNDWYNVIFNGKVGYMFSTYITPSVSAEIEKSAAMVRGNGVRLRDGAGYDAKVITNLNYGTAVNVIGVDGCWYKVAYGDQTGYMHSDYILFPSSVSSEESSSTGSRIATFAQKYMGTPYVYGGASPSGFDCSGFTSYVLKNNGYNATRTCTTLYAQYPHINKSELRVGDLVFFASYSSWDTNHVGIYIGNDKFIHASSGAGYVTISSLSDWYYNNFYYGAARYINY